jgi:hypothetical protein
MNITELLDAPQYSIPQAQKEAVLLGHLNDLDLQHRSHCAEYGRLVSTLHPDLNRAQSLAELPFIPVGLFKSHELRSVPQSEVFKTLTSSGTTGQQVSRIYLDRETAQHQRIALARIMTHVLGPDRLPMIVIDSATLIKDRNQFSARGAGVMGMVNFGRQHFYALDENMDLDEPGLLAFLQKFGDKPFLMFGFTFMVWQYFLQRMIGKGIDLSHGILVHSGGWKKLEQVAVSNTEFKRRLRESTGLARVYNFYGMVEQVGSVYLEGEDGYLYAPNFADVIVRDPVTWREAPVGVAGVIQVLSILPSSYPGHSVLTEDMGVVRGIDASTCGRLGKYFSVIGRVPKAELRGCSDTYASRAAV